MDEAERVRHRLDQLENQMSRVVTTIKTGDMSWMGDTEDTTVQAWQDPEATMVFSRPIGLRAAPPDEDQRPYPALPKRKLPWVDAQADLEEEDRRLDPLGLQPAIDASRQTEHMKRIIAPSEVMETHAATKIDEALAAAWQSGHRAALVAAEARVLQYMNPHFSTATVEGVVQAVRGDQVEFVDPTPTGFHQAYDPSRDNGLDETMVMHQHTFEEGCCEPKDVDGNPDVRTPWTDDRAQRPVTPKDQWGPMSSSYDH